ncbi:glycosyltransferase family 2 protein [Clostridium perfringens]|uniref:glycosyltransferase family 2 protein n=1 Tax=Clostridium perfringens TaxID=1502 RepID=UPI0018E42E13|nr:glycosyltransferase family 2 protein [Clostridium perfringens]MBI6077506.1 glycosyltransferase family 2 protein [Clostridium perfringens]
MNEKLVSIIMPTYNCEKFIEETILSVLNQKYQNWELLISDDCSTDNTQEIVEKYSKNDLRIKYHKLKENVGAAMARNDAMARANGYYMAFLDSDDLWDKDKLKLQIEFMEKNNYNFTCTAYRQIDEEGKSLDKVIKTNNKTNYNGLLLNCPVGNSTVMYNVNSLGKFEVPNIRKRNDDALWLKILKKEKFIYGMNDILMSYRVRKNSISSNKLDLVKYHWYLYRDIEHLSLIRSTFHIIFWGLLKILKIK